MTKNTKGKKPVTRSPVPRNNRLSVRFTEDERSLVDHIAARTGRSSSDWARWVILRVALEENLDQGKDLTPNEIRMLPKCAACGHAYTSHVEGDLIGPRCAECARSNQENWAHEYIMEDEMSSPGSPG